MARRIRSSMAAATALLFMLVLLPAGSASGHSAAQYLPIRWKTDLTQNWRFTTSFPDPNGPWRDRVRDGLNYVGSGDGHGPNWNQLGEPLVWTQKAAVDAFNPNACPAAGMNAIHWRNIDGRDGVLAMAVLCIYDNDRTRIWSANMVFDPDEDWYTGTGDSPNGTFFGNQLGGFCLGRCAIDAWSIAAHEWGHMSGFTGGPTGEGHFLITDLPTCNDDQTGNTMCEGYHKGHDHGRTLESHDKHTFTARY
jgi:hypothetical protein